MILRSLDLDCIVSNTNNVFYLPFQRLDRDAGTGGNSVWQLLIEAQDDNGNGLKSFTQLTINLIDVNDNAPFLSSVSLFLVHFMLK